MIQQKEQADKRLLTMELVTGILCLIPLAAAVVVGTVVPMKESTATLIILAGLLPLLIATPFMLRIEQTAGYYECKKGIDFAAKVQNSSPVVARWDEYMSDILIMEKDADINTCLRTKMCSLLHTLTEPDI